MQYKAMGGEEYITLGNFNDTNYLDTMYVPAGGNQFWMQGTYYFIDDIWLSHCDSLPDSIIGINESSLESELNLYPNPFQETFSLKYSNKKKLQFILFNALGQTIDIKIQKQGKNYLIQPKDIPKGIYWLQASDGNEKASFKIIKL
jgi:hypothetical protein